MQNSPPSPPPWQPHSNHVEGRLTRLEVTQDTHGERITLLERVLYGLIVALAGIMHEKLPRVLDMISSFKP